MDGELRKAYLACQTIARNEAGNFFWAFRFLPRKKRWALSAVYAFCRIADDLVDHAADPHKARQDLHQMLSNLDAALSGAANGTIYLALADACREFDIPRQPFEDLIRGVEMDVEGIEYASVDDVELYCRRVASSVGLMSIAIFGARHPDSIMYADELGMALQWTNILRDVGEDADWNRVYIPNNLLEQHKISRGDVLTKSDSVPWHRLFDDVYRHALSRYRNAQHCLPQSDLRALVPAEIMQSIYLATLYKIKRLKYPVLHRRVSLSILTKIAISLRVVLFCGILGVRPRFRSSQY